MKLPIRPKVYPSGIAELKRSANRQKSIPRFRQKIRVAISTAMPPPVVRHPADPDEMKTAVEFEGEEDLQRVFQVVAEVVEEDVAEAAAEDHPEDRPDEEILDQLRRIGEILPSDPAHDKGDKCRQRPRGTSGCTIAVERSRSRRGMGSDARGCDATRLMQSSPSQ